MHEYNVFKDSTVQRYGKYISKPT